MHSFPRFIALTVLASLPVVAFAAQGNAAKGRRAFQAQCASCHATTAENRATGPALLNIAGRAAASLDGFAFSAPMKNSGLTWDASSLDRFLAAPTEVVPGTTMTQPVTSATTRADIIAFLHTLKTPPPAK